MVILVVRIKQPGARGAGCFEYKNEMPLENSKIMAILFSDLERYGANIEKIYREWKKMEQEEFPF